MAQLRHAHNASHTVADAHGRNIDLTATGPAPTHDCPCTRPFEGARPRGRPGAAVIRVAAVLAAGLVASVLLIAVRDIVVTMASTGIGGLILKVLLMPSNKRDRR